MARVVTYANNHRECFCQLQLESGDRVFVSIGSGKLRISKMTLWGLVPTRTLLELGTNEADEVAFYALFVPLSELDQWEDEQKALPETVPMLDRVVQALLPCRSLGEVEQRLDARRQATKQIMEA